MTPDQVRSLRSQLGLTQRQLAEHLGLSVNTVIAWEHGNRVPGRESANRMAVMVQPGKVRAATLSQCLNNAAVLADARAQADIAEGNPKSAEVTLKLAGHLRRLASASRADDPVQIAGILE